MPEASVALEVSDEQNRIKPDLFSFYTCEIVDLLTRDEDFLLPVSRNKESPDISSKVLENGKVADSSSHTSSLFNNSIEDSIPDVKRELLKASLKQSVRALTKEVDEMIDPVIRIRHIISCLRSKNQHSEAEFPLDMDPTRPPCKKLKTSPSNGERFLFADQNKEAEKEREVNEDLKFLLESENSLHLEEILTRHSDELGVMLNHMEQQLEVLLDAVGSKCRPMTRQEKQQLRKLIEKLPLRNLDGIVEIIHRGKSSDCLSSEEIFVDLEQLDNVTVWRLYFHVKAVENARKLSAQVSSETRV